MHGRTEFETVRQYVFRFYESEDEYSVTETERQLFAAIAPYLEYEEAFRDPERDRRMKRLLDALGPQTAVAERVIFALEFPTIEALTSKLDSGLIKRDVYEQQLAKLSPVTFNVKRVQLWARAHLGEETIRKDRIP